MAVVAKLGLQAKFEKKELTAEDQKALIEAYEQANGKGSFQSDLQAFEAEQKQKKEDEERSRIFQELAVLLGKEGSSSSVESMSQVVDAVRDLKATIKKLGAQSQGDRPETTVNVPLRACGPHTEKFAFGVQHPIFDSSKRHNRIAMTHAISGSPTGDDEAAFRRDFSAYADALFERLKSHIENGTLHDVIKGSVDYSALVSDPEIGSRYLTVRQDALIARLVSLPNLDGLFPKVSNVQSGDVLTNVLFTEISQAYQKGRVFKGNISFKPEKAVVDKAMVKVQFEDMSALERSYLNYLNKSGSDPVKWTLIEWLILEVAKQISNERIRRSIMGYRIEPESGVAGHTMFASTGVVHRLIGLYEERKVCPFLDADLSTYSKEDIGDVLLLFAELVAGSREDWQTFVVYMNANHKPWYTAWYESKYGKNQDYTGPQAKVPHYDIPIRWVPAMGDMKFIFATVPDNIMLLENVPGEEYKMQFQRDLEEVIAFSYWMEGAGVAFSGIQRESLDELKKASLSDQLVFMNWPCAALAADAATADASKGMMFRTGKNTKATALTDITGAKEGIVYRIEIGDASFPTSIAKSGKFSELKSAWSPTKAGEYIKLYYDKKNDKFCEVARG